MRLISARSNRINPTYTIGARINNLGSDLTFYDIGAPLPLIFSIGAAAAILDDPDSGMKVTLLADATKPQDASSSCTRRPRWSFSTCSASALATSTTIRV